MSVLQITGFAQRFNNVFFVALFDGADGAAGINRPRFKLVIGWYETERSDADAFRNVVAGHDDRIGADAGVFSEPDVALNLLDLGNGMRNQFVDVVVAAEPDLDAGGQTGAVAISKVYLPSPPAM